MDNETFKDLYMGKFNPHPFELKSVSELLEIEKCKWANQEDRRLARKIRIRIAETNERQEKLRRDHRKQNQR